MTPEDREHRKRHWGWVHISGDRSKPVTLPDRRPWRLTERVRSDRGQRGAGA